MFDPQDRSRFFTDAELGRLLEAVRTRRHKNQPRDHALFALLATTGIRPSEALAIRRNDVHLVGREPWIRVHRLKTRRPVAVAQELAIPDELANTLRVHAETVETGGLLFAMSRRQAERLFHHYVRQARIPGRSWLYCLRHTAATRIYRATRDIRTVQAILGHAHPDMSAIYAHVTRTMLREWAQTSTAVV